MPRWVLCGLSIRPGSVRDHVPGRPVALYDDLKAGPGLRAVRKIYQLKMLRMGAPRHGADAGHELTLAKVLVDFDAPGESFFNASRSRGFTFGHTSLVTPV